MRYAYTSSLLILYYYTVGTTYIPCFTVIAENFSISNNDVKSSMTYFLLSSVFSCFIVGIYADQVGKKNSLKIGIILTSIGILISLIAPSIELFNLGRFLQGAGSTVGLLLGFSIIVDLYDRDSSIKAFALVGALVTIGAGIAPYIGSLLTELLHWRSVFVFILLFSIYVFIDTHYIIPLELNKICKSNARATLRASIKIIRNRNFIANGLMNPIYLSGYWFSSILLPFYFADTLGMSLSLLGFYLSLTIYSFSLGAFIAPLITVRLFNLKVNKSIYLGLALGFVSALALIGVHYISAENIFLITAALCLYNFALGLTYPATLSAALSEYKELTTITSSVRTLFVTLLAALGSAMSQFVKANPLNLGLYLLACMILMTALFELRVKSDSSE